jgi:flavorubredoxin
MESRVTELAKETYRISTFHPEYGIQFNQFLIKDDQPFLWHTGFRKMFPTTLAGVASVIDPAELRWIGFSHFESDECGALNQWLEAAPRSQAVCSTVGAKVMVDDFADRAPRPLADDETLPTGRHRLRFLATPHVPHAWDAGLMFDEVEQTLLCSDLFFHPGDPAPLAGSDVISRARDAIQHNLVRPLAKDIPYSPYTISTLERLAALRPRSLAVMHGSSFQGDGQGAVLALAAAIKEFLGAVGDTTASTGSRPPA